MWFHHSDLQRGRKRPPGPKQLQRHYCCFCHGKSSGVSHPRETEYSTSRSRCHSREPNGIIIYYRRGVGCTDAIFATQETIAKHVREGSAVHMCLYDLQKAFDSVEFPVLLDHLFSIGKTWRIINSWYEGGSCCVKVEDRLSNAFPVQRGVQQGSVLSPTLFL